MIDLNSLPDSLREQIQETASTMVPIRPAQQPAPSDTIQSLIAEIARQSPELFVAMLLDSSKFCGIETIETEDTSEDQVVEVQSYAYGKERVVRPMKSTKTIRRLAKMCLRSGADDEDLCAAAKARLHHTRCRAPAFVEPVLAV